MTDADDARAQLEQLKRLMRGAVTDGSGAAANTKDVITGLKFASEQLQGARSYAAQQLEQLIAMSDQLEIILEGSLNADLIEAQGKLRVAIRRVEDFLNRSQSHINNIDKIRAIIQIQILPLIEEPGTILNQVDLIIEQWAQFL